MTRKSAIVVSLVAALAACWASRAGAEGAFMRLTPLPAPKVIAAAKAFPGGAYSAAFLLDGEENSEYASDGKGTNTFVEFDFGAPVIIGAFRHVDRHDLANVATSQLTFSDAAGHPLATVSVPHVGQSSGVTMFALPKPVTAQKVRWQVTKVAHQGIDCVGGREISFFKAGPPEPAPHGIRIAVQTVPVAEQQDGRLVQSLRVALEYPYADAYRRHVARGGPRRQADPFDVRQPEPCVFGPRPYGRPADESCDRVRRTDGGREYGCNAQALAKDDGLSAAPLAHRHRLHAPSDRRDAPAVR